MRNYNSKYEEWWVPLLTFAAVAMTLIFIWIMGSCMESKSYNEITGANTTTWQAMWVQLRVQDAPNN